MDYYKDDQNYNLNDENILDQEIKKVKKKRKYYTSNNQDLLIRNGITGDKYGFKKGSKSELALFKVMDTTGRVDEEGFILTKKKIIQQQIQSIIIHLKNIKDLWEKSCLNI